MNKVYIKGQSLNIEDTIRMMSEQKGINKVFHYYDMIRKCLLFNILFDDLDHLADALRVLKIPPYELHAMTGTPSIATLVYRIKGHKIKYTITQ